MTTITLPRLETILLASDLSEGASAATDAAGWLAEAAGSRLHALYVDERGPAEAPRQRRGGDPGPALERRLRRYRPSEGDLFVSRRTGAAADAILSHATEVGADLLVLGRHRRRRADGLLGSTADRVAGACGVPILLVNQRLRLPTRTVTVALDLSPESRQALLAALRFLALLGPVAGPSVRLQVVHVRPYAGSEEAPGMERALIRHTLEAEVAEIMGAAATPAHAHEIGVDIAEGLPVADRILAAASAADSDLIVLGSRGRAGWRRALLGSVASAVARAADRPVLLVPPARPGEVEPIDA